MRPPTPAEFATVIAVRAGAPCPMCRGFGVYSDVIYDESDDVNGGCHGTHLFVCHCLVGRCLEVALK